MIYSEEVMKHFKNPKNLGEMKDADGVGTVGNPKCGDVMKLYIKIGERNQNKKLNIKNKKNGKDIVEKYIKDVKFQTLGCGAAIACSSMTTQLVKGKSLDEALKISNKNVNEALGSLPQNKYHCSILAEQAIKSAIGDYKSKQVSPPKGDLPLGGK